MRTAFKKRTGLLQRFSKPKPHKEPLPPFDRTLFNVIVILSLFGAIMIYSGSVLVAVKQGNPPYIYFLRQLLWVFLGLIAMLIISRIRYTHYKKLITPALVLTFICLIGTLLININNPIKRWIDIGPFQFQPSELAKLTFVLYLAHWLANIKPRTGIHNTFKQHIINELVPFLVLLFSLIFLILIQPDLDTTITIGLTAFSMYYISGNDQLHLIGTWLTGFTMVILGGIATLLAKYRLVRINSYLRFWETGKFSDPTDVDYQLRQIIVAVASGQFWGRGFGESRQKFYYLGDTAFSDTIFAIFAEEFGFIGCVLLVAVFIFIFFTGIKIAKHAPDKLGFLLALGITIWLTVQAFMHIAANVALIPINGNTLPFISYGGSSTIINLAAIGILLNISRYSKYDKNTSK